MSKKRKNKAKSRFIIVSTLLFIAIALAITILVMYINANNKRNSEKSDKRELPTTESMISDTIKIKLSSYSVTKTIGDYITADDFIGSVSGTSNYSTGIVPIADTAFSLDNLIDKVAVEQNQELFVIVIDNDTQKYQFEKAYVAVDDSGFKVNLKKDSVNVDKGAKVSADDFIDSVEGPENYITGIAFDASNKNPDPSMIISDYIAEISEYIYIVVSTPDKSSYTYKAVKVNVNGYDEENGSDNNVERPAGDSTNNNSSDILPDATPGSWDLTSLNTAQTPYGNDANDVTEAGIPQGVFWYTNKWSKYNADFISDIGIKVNKKESDQKIIYLTMDCGFDNPETELILNTLKEKNVKATFFVTSMFYDARPDLIKRMIDEGHRIGSHSINHKDMTTLSVEEQKTEIMDVVNKLKNDFGYDCRLFRFPEGYFSDQTLAVVDNLGLKSVFWSYAYNDFSSVQPEVAPSLEAAVKYLHPGAIYLLHASSSTNRAFIGDWIDQARNLGYEFGGVYPVERQNN